MDDTSASESIIDELAALIADARRIVAFTGAGISTESGIPDFRSPGGVWDRYAPIEFRAFLASEEARRETWRRGIHTYPVVAAAQPNRAHHALVGLERRGKLAAVITQNIDGLHQRAGHRTDRVIELHGNAHGVRCLTCSELYDRHRIHERVLAGEEEPLCGSCDGILKPTTVSFGEPMPPGAMQQAGAEIVRCDLVLVVGSSLAVYPAAGLPREAMRRGTPVAILNATPTPLDSQAALVARGQAGTILPSAVRRATCRR